MVIPTTVFITEFIDSYYPRKVVILVHLASLNQNLMLLIHRLNMQIVESHIRFDCVAMVICNLASHTCFLTRIALVKCSITHQFYLFRSKIALSSYQLIHKLVVAILDLTWLLWLQANTGIVNEFLDLNHLQLLTFVVILAFK